MRNRELREGYEAYNLGDLEEERGNIGRRVWNLSSREARAYTDYMKHPIQIDRLTPGDTREN